MPGERPEDALREAEALGESGAPTVLTLLGETVTDRGQARDVFDHYLDLLHRIDERGLDAELSVKPTQLGLDLDPGLAVDHLDEIVEEAERRDGGVVWIDMEASPYVDPTLDLFRELRSQHEGVGICLQASLRRTPNDLESLLRLEPAIRLVKGAYNEPAEVAFPDRATVDARYVELAGRLLEARVEGRAGRPAIATHDMTIVRKAVAMADALGLARDAWEVEMLYGIARKDQRRLLSDGVALRILISYGEHWFPWYMRRLAERPANVGFVLRKLVGL